MLFVGYEALKTQALAPLASSLIVLVAFFVIADGSRITGSQALNALADMRAPMLITALVYWGISIPFGALFGFVLNFGVQGIWIGLILGSVAAVVWYFMRFQRLVREL
uniref:MatE n=1 Tax=Candidatus Kentrum sp. LPFa TaxID=2126335 RepID=A0A450Y1H6_9GAMM|nr:MAG: MatE [Candidatus Kentron sp. LPFa]VFK35383.1 MAG: MatE [Candidatus Kentron sp. LPFa]